VLIAGGAGSVAHYAIQLAKLRGARVLTTVSSPEKAAHARAAGADAIINYREEDVGERVRALTEGRGVDAVIEMDLSRNARYYPNVLRPFATVAVYGMSANEATLPSLWLMQNNIDLRFLFVYEMPTEDRAAAVTELSERLAANQLTHTIARRVPLADVAEAHDIVERGELIGNVILDIG
jgi:NADPH2:quinone reductase